MKRKYNLSGMIIIALTLLLVSTSLAGEGDRRRDKFKRCGGLPTPLTVGADPATNFIDVYESITVTQPGTVIENLHLRGGITVKASDVTIRNCKIDGLYGSYYGVNVPWDGYYTNVRIENNTFTHQKSSGVLVSGGGSAPEEGILVARNVFSEEGADGIKVGSNAIFECNYIEKLGYWSDAHADGAQSVASSQVIFRSNFFNLPVPGASKFPGPPWQNHSGLMFNTDVWYVEWIWIVNNLISGGGYSVYARDAHHGYGSPTNFFVTDNIFTNQYSSALLSADDFSKITFENNTCLESGKATVENRCPCDENGDGDYSEYCPWHSGY